MSSSPLDIIMRGVTSVQITLLVTSYHLRSYAVNKPSPACLQLMSDSYCVFTNRSSHSTHTVQHTVLPCLPDTQPSVSDKVRVGTLHSISPI